MKKRILLLSFCLFFCSLIFSGCVHEYNKSEVSKYVKEEIGLKHIIVSKTSREDPSDTEYKDKIWDVKDLDHDISFHVYDDRTWGLESVVNSLKDDYDFAYLKHYYPSISNKDSNIKFIDESDSDHIYAYLQFGFNDYSELKERCDSLHTYFKELNNTNPNFTINIHSYWDDEITKLLIKDDKDIFESRYSLSTGYDIKDFKGDSFYNSLAKYYVSVGMEYQLPGLLENADKDLIKQVLKSDSTRIVYQINPDTNKREFYTDFTSSTSEIAYGALFKIATEEGMNPEGDMNHFTLNGRDGHRYEFSLEYVDHYDEWDSETFYYYKDDEKVFSTNRNKPMLDFNVIKDISGIQLYYVSYSNLASNRFNDPISESEQN